MKRYRVVTTLREGIRDNQGVAVQKVLSGDTFGFSNLNSVRIGKTYTFSLEDNVDIHTICKKGLINEVMEDYFIEEWDSENEEWRERVERSQNWFISLLEWFKSLWV